MKTHLHKFLTKMAEHHAESSRHHLGKAEHHEQLGQRYGSLAKMAKAKNDGEDSATIYKAISEAHATSAEEHQSMAEEHQGMAAACVKLAKTLAATGDWPALKAAGMDNGDEIMPTEVHAVVPDVPKTARAIPRAGMRALPTADENPLFAKVFGTDEVE
jgi:hypothetical protein